jgi:formate dehydrogenase subunit gamma
MIPAIGRLDEGAGRHVGGYGRTTPGERELLRHPVYTRLLHWSAAGLFILSLLSGFALYTPWLFRMMTPLFGGGAMARELHPWFSLGFVLLFALQLLNWLTPMSWTPADSRWLRRIREYVTNAETLEPEDVGFFNGGQKLYFWAIVGSAVVFLVSGVPMWFPGTFGRLSVAVSYVMHDLAALVMLGGFIVHLYESTAQQPGTFQAMTRGVVAKKWAWTHQPAWYREVSGRDPRDDYEHARHQHPGSG